MSAGFERSATPKRVTVAVLAAGYITFVNMWCTQAILPQLAATFRIAPAATGVAVTAPLLATALMAPLIGAISDRFGRRRLIIAAAFLLALPSALSAEAPNFDVFVLARFLQGLTLPFIFTITIAYIGDETSGPATVRLAGTYISGTICGGFSGRLLTGLVTQDFGWRIALLAVAALTLIMAFVAAVAMPRERNFRPVYGIRRALYSFPLHLSNPRLLATYGVGFGVLFSLVAVFTYINFRLAAAPYFLGPAALGTIFVVYLGGVVMSPVAARLSNRFGQRPVMGFAGGAVFLGLGLTLATPLSAIIAGLLILCSGIFVQQTLATAFVGMTAREAKSTAVGLYVTFYYIGGSFGGIVPAHIWRDAGWPGCVMLVAVMQVAMAGLVMTFWRAETAARRNSVSH